MIEQEAGGALLINYQAKPRSRKMAPWIR